jgi:hypothetical protein
MKKLNKVIINPVKVIKNEELVNLRGGYIGTGNSTCYCKDSGGTTHITETFEDCNCSKETRWVSNTCLPAHLNYSYCDCNPCV